MNVRFPCPQCGKKLVTAGKAGARLTCPGCQAKLRVPGTGETPAVAAPLPAGIPSAEAPDGENTNLRAMVVIGAAVGVLALLVVGAILLLNSGGAAPDPGNPPVVQVDPKTDPKSIDTTPISPNDNPGGKVEPTLVQGISKPRGMEPEFVLALERGKGASGPDLAFAKLGPDPVQVAVNPKGPDPFTKEPKEKTKEPTGGAFAQALDNFGNPKAQEAGLIKEADFKGKRLLVWSGTVPVVNNLPLSNPLLKRFADLGMKIRVERPPFRTEWLKETDIFFLFSTNKDVGTPMNRTDIDAVENFVRAGKALYLMSDNYPLIVEADALGQRLFGVRVSGDYPGEKTAYVKARNMTKDQLQKFRGQYPVDDHSLLTGVNFIWEGVTISHMTPCDKLEVVLRASDGKILAAVSRDPKLRVVMDCGHTRYYPQYVTNTPGTLRFAENVAAFLLGNNSR